MNNKPLPTNDSTSNSIYNSLSHFNETAQHWLELTTILKAEIEDINSQLAIAKAKAEASISALDKEWELKARTALRNKKAQLNLLKQWSNTYYPCGVNSKVIKDEQAALLLKKNDNSDCQNRITKEITSSLELKSKISKLQCNFDWIKYQLQELIKILVSSDIKLQPKQNEN